MALIHLTVVTPEGKPYDADAQRVIVRTTSGDVCILPKHIAYAAALGEGNAQLVTAEGSVQHAYIKGGMLHVTNDVVQIITNSFRWKDKPES